MIVILGVPAWNATEPAGPAGRSARIALSVAAAGGRVEIVGRAGDDAQGDALLIALARAGVGHAAVLRDPSRPTATLTPAPDDDSAGFALDAEEPVATVTRGPGLEAADVSLGLSYLTSFGVLVVTDEVPLAARRAAVDAAAFAGAAMVLLLANGEPEPADMPATATVLEAPRDPDDAAFGALVGAYAVALESGESPADAFAVARGAGWEAVGPSA
jgi:hypothetical protein